MKTLVKITKNFQITIPAKLRKRSGFKRVKEGEYLEADVKKGSFVFSPRAIDIDPDQKWFWTKEWQKMEREAEEDIKHGRVKSFSTMNEFVKELKSIKK